jgi:hypothetical protein
LADGFWRTAPGGRPRRRGPPGRPPFNRRSERATGSRMAVRHAVRWPSTRCRPLGLPIGRPLVPSAGGRPTRTFVRTLGRLDTSGRRPSDVIFPKDVRCDNPGLNYIFHKLSVNTKHAQFRLHMSLSRILVVNKY